MNDFLNWLDNYKSLLVSGITLILTIVLLFIKKRPKTIDEFLRIVDNVCAYVLPSTILKVEVPGNGALKKKEVRNVALNVITKKLGRVLTDFEKSLALQSIDESIEAILSAPQKKQV